jgi:SM-20-related protein
MMMHELLAEQVLADESILSAGEKQLISSLLQHCNDAAQRDEGVAEAIAHAVGEVVSSRVNVILGEQIVERLTGMRRTARLGAPPIPNPTGPRPPGPNPPGISTGSVPDRDLRLSSTPPIPDPGPRPPGPNPPGPGISNIPAGNGRLWMGSTPPVPSPDPGPRPPGPNPPGGISVVEHHARGMMKPNLTANCVVLDEFLAPAELLSLANYALQHEQEFQISEVVSPGVRGGVIETETRRSRVLMDLGPHRELIVTKITAALPGVLRALGHDPFNIHRIEAQITASNHGDFFHWHSDNGVDEIAGREITFVYFFHREPKPFIGGELRIYDSRWDHDHYVPAAGYRVITPEQNQLVLFHSSLTHEITPVQAPSHSFADSRFTVNGWFHK